MNSWMTIAANASAVAVEHPAVVPNSPAPLGGDDQTGGDEMMNAFKTKAKRCCSQEHNRLVRRLGSCEMASNTSGERHACYRQEAKASGRRARQCMRSHSA